MLFLRTSFRFISIGFLALLLGQYLPAHPSAAKAANLPAVTGVYTLYLPSIRTPNNSIFGAYLSQTNDLKGIAQISAANLGWTRIDLSWKEIEPSYGNIDWTRAANFDFRIAKAANAGLKPIVIFADTPAWALKPGFSCGPIQQNYFAEYARFVAQAVKRYSDSPYGAFFYEFYNEPDAPGFLGCWGDTSDPLYFGGGYYGQMLKSVYPAVKAVNPQIQVLVGGLLLTCDPTNPPNDANNPGSKADCTPSRFLEGILANGAGGAFDGVAYHSYDYYAGNYDYNNPNWNASRTTTGPASLVKAAYLRKVLQSYNLANKPLYNTEFALFHGPENSQLSDPLLEPTKSYYVVESMAGFLAEKNQTAIWHETFGNRNNSLLEDDLSPKPVYTAYAFVNKLLANAVWSQKVTNNPSFVIHEFNKLGKKIWIVWTVDNQSRILTLPANTFSVDRIDATGNPVADTLLGTSITLDFAPAIIQFAP